MSRQFFFGLDLGQAHDPTSTACIERAELRRPWDAVRFGYPTYVELRLRYLESVPLATPYPEVARHMGNLMQSPAITGGAELVVDATGVGRPVVDLLRQQRLNGLLTPVNITGGLSANRSADGIYNVPKRDLIIGLQVAFQRGTLKIAGSSPLMQKFIEEMAAMRTRINSAGTEQFGAWKEGEHDDLVLAVALACWGARKAYPFDPN